MYNLYENHGPYCVGVTRMLPLGLRKLAKKSRLEIGQIRTRSTERIGRRIGNASPEAVEQAIAGLSEIIGS